MVDEGIDETVTLRVQHRGDEREAGRMSQARSTQEAVASFTEQSPLDPGMEGYWKVWGANVSHVREGDLVATKVGDQVVYDLICGTFEAKAAPLRRGFIDDKGKQFTLGAMCPIVLLRWGTKNTLAE